MLVPKFKPVSRTNVPQAPDWVDKITDPIVGQVEDLTRAAQNQLSFADNFNSEIREFNVLHDVWTYVDLRVLKGAPMGCFLLWTEEDQYYQFRWKVVDLARVGVRVKFTADPGVESKIRILVVGK